LLAAIVFARNHTVPVSVEWVSPQGLNNWETLRVYSGRVLAPCAQGIAVLDQATGAVLVNIDAAGAAGVAVSRGLAFFGTNQGSVNAFDITTGNITWTQSPTNTGQPIWPYFLEADATTNNLYVVDSTCTLWAFQAHSGTLLWNYSWTTPCQDPPNLAVSKGHVIFQCGPTQVCNIDIYTGNITWSFMMANAAGAAPIIDDNNVYVVDTQGNFAALTLKTGALAWNKSTAATDGRTNIASNSVFVVYGDALGFVWAFDALAGHTLWGTATLGQQIYEVAISENSRVFAIDVAGNVFELAGSTGTVKWTYTSPQWSNAGGFSIAYADNVVYIGAYETCVAALAIN